MKLKSYLPLLNGYETTAELRTDHAASSYGQPVLVMDGGEALGPAECAFADYRILEATEEEVAGLEAAGYHLPRAGGTPYPVGDRGPQRR